ncbi:phage tail tip lysozyme [Levilactobacillus spicheri]|uniref:Phage tail tape measure protein domain-containing protein n=1 Tax=Levilactobacillus spicheri TaxID=216463 RepID=A0ABQ0WQD8_9LACO|nr:phage tail tip lysozyme [Levilactobacillus spicheri]GEO67303.1 hypothetical protein LSP04_17220 [Levilactobacillus spicheri]
MASELRREDVGIGFNIEWQKLEKLDNSITRVIDKIHDVGSAFGPANNDLKTFGRTFTDVMDKAVGSNDKVAASNREVSKSIQESSRVTTNLRDKYANLNQVVGEYGTKQPAYFRKVGTSINQVGDQVTGLSKKLREMPKDMATKVSFDTNGVNAGDVTRQFDKVDRSMDKTAKKSRRLHDIIMGTFVGTAISNGVAALTNGLHEAAQAGMEYNKEQDTMKTVWTSLTTEAPKDGKNLVKYINSMSQHSIYAADTLNEMAQSFYHVHSNEKETKNWTNDFIALGSTLHMSNDALAESGEQFAKIVAGGKASSEDMAVMINRFPMFGEALQKATGKSMKQLYAMSAAGKLSAKQFTDTLTYLGKKYEGGTKEAMTSFMGMSMYLKSRFSTLAGDVMKTSFNMDKQTAKSMQDLLKDDMMKKYAKGMSSALGVVTGAAVDGINYLDKHKDTILDVMKNIGDIGGIFGKAVWTDSIDILTDIGDAFGLVDKNGKAAKDPLDQLDNLLKGIDQHKGAIKLAAKAMVGFFAVKKATQFLKMLKEINTQLKLTTALDAADSYQGILFGGGKGKRAGGGKSSSKVATKIEEAIESGGTAGGRHFAKEAKKGGTAAGKTGGRGFATKIKNGAKVAGRTGGGLFSDAIHNIAWMTIASKFATDGSQVFLDGISTKKGAKAAWKLGGDTVGGAIGFYLGGPAGAAVGTYIGGAIADQLSKWADWYQKNGTASPAGDKSDHQRKYNSKHTAALTNSLSTNATGGPIGTVNTKSTYPSESHGILNPSGITSKKKKKKSIVTKPITGFASGGPTIKPGMAMVAEAGTEIGYDARSGKYQIFDHGPQLVHLTAGMHIMNHRDSLKAMRGGLGRGRILPGYAKGTGSIGAASVATTVKVKGVNDATMKNTEYKTKRSADKIGSDITKGYAKGTKGAHSKLTGFNKQSDRLWKTNQSETNKRTDEIRKGIVSDFDAGQKGADKQLTQLKNHGLKTMDKLQDGMAKADQAIVSDFGSIFGKLPSLAKSAMKGAITNLNGGFSGIDSALAQFGGNKSVLKPIHYATGSNGPIDSDQLAVLNDAQTGPRQELVGRGDRLLKPIGYNGVFHLKKGDNVFNGSQVERARPYLPHFKKGTGASDSKLRSLASKNSGDPSGAFKSEFTDNVKANGSTLQKGLTNTANAGAKTVGVPWENAMWGYIESLINAGDGSAAGGNWRHDPGMPKTNGFGAARSFGSHDGVDFSSHLGAPILAVHGGKVTRTGNPVWAPGALGKVITVKSDDGYQEIYQEFGTMKNILVHVGDIIKTGQKIATLGPLNGSGSGPHVHIGVSHGSLWDHGGSSTKGWFDVTKMSGSDNGSSKLKSKSKAPKVSKAMTALVKSQLGPSAAKWIKKNLQDSIGDADVGSLGGSVASRARTLAKAIKSMYGAATNAGIAAVLGNWEFESGLNPGAINPGGGASGLGQWLGGRKTALINYSKRHGKNWKSAEAQLEFALKGDGSDSSVLKSVLRGNGSVASLASKFSTQWERGGYTAQHVAGARKVEAALHDNGGWSQPGKVNIFGEKSREVAINPNKPNADSLIKDAIQARAGVDSSGFSAAVSNAVSGRARAPRPAARVAGSSRPINIKMTNRFEIKGGNADEVSKQVSNDMQKVGQQLVDMLRRGTGTDQGEGGFVI